MSNYPNYSSNVYGANSYASSAYLKYTQGVQELWCADFVSWLYDQAKYPLEPDPNWKVSYVPSIEAIGQANQNFHWHPESSGYIPKPGDIDIIVYGNNPATSHTGIFVSYNSSTGMSSYIAGDSGHGPWPGGSAVRLEVGLGHCKRTTTHYSYKQKDNRNKDYFFH